ncbi:MAG: hypothetical protein ACKVQJ_06975 [Pyrinomonadaceae bacterium]
MTKSIPESVRPFEFESYGVNIRIDGNRQYLIDEAEKVARRALLDDIRPVATSQFQHIFKFELEEDGFILLTDNGEFISRDDVFTHILPHFNSLVRVAVAEDAFDRVFIHAGAVGWRGKAILMPADSFKGKSTLVAELVRNGAVYYSDDYAIFDRNGLMYPFARKLSMRTADAKFVPYELTVDQLGGTVGTEPIRVGTVLFTEYDPKGKWQPKLLTSGNGVLELIPFTFSFINRPDFSLPVLNNIASHATIVSSLRGSAVNFAKTLLKFIDKNVD